MREYLESPELVLDIPKLGKVRVMVTSGERLYVEQRDHSCVIRGIPHTFTANLRNTSEGLEISKCAGLCVDSHRDGASWGTNATPDARNFVKENLVPFLRQWWENSPNFRNAGARVDLNNRLCFVEKDIAEKEAELAKYRESARDLQKELDALPTP